MVDNLHVTEIIAKLEAQEKRLAEVETENLSMKKRLQQMEKDLKETGRLAKQTERLSEKIATFDEESDKAVISFKSFKLDIKESIESLKNDLCLVDQELRKGLNILHAEFSQ